MEACLVTIHSRQIFQHVMICWLELTIPLHTRIILLFQKKKKRLRMVLLCILCISFHVRIINPFFVQEPFFQPHIHKVDILLYRNFTTLKSKDWLVQSHSSSKTKTMFQNPDHHPVVKTKPASIGAKQETDWLLLFPVQRTKLSL